MREKRATKQAVEAAIKQLEANGAQPTANRILEITGGSKSTVLRQMKELGHGIARRTGGEEADDVLPAVLLEKAKPFIKELMEGAAEIERAKYASFTERYHRNMEDFESALEEDGKRIEALTAQNTDLAAELAAAREELEMAVHAWRQKPHLVALGNQKNFQIFNDEAIAEGVVPDLSEFKNLMAQALLYRRAEKLIRPAFQGFQANITAYTISVIANRLGDRISLSQIWQQQAISDAFVSLIIQWSREVNDALRSSAGQRIVSEWAKKEECWEYVKSREFSEPAVRLPEMQY